MGSLRIVRVEVRDAPFTVPILNARGDADGKFTWLEGKVSKRRDNDPRRRQGS